MANTWWGILSLMPLAAYLPLGKLLRPGTETVNGTE